MGVRVGWEYVEYTEGSGDLPQPRIVVVGCGGGGCNSVHRLNEIGISCAETVAINTDRPHLSRIKAHKRLLIGQGVTNGLGAGSDPNVGRTCAENSVPEISKLLYQADLTFITVGLGGGTGTGLAPVVADVARRQGSVVVVIATTPFEVEGSRNRVALRGIRELRGLCDTLLLLDNNRLLEMVANLPVHQAFAVMDQLISEIIKGMVEAITEPSLINLDFADLRTIMRKGGISTVLYGENSDPESVVKDALSNPLLDIDISGAKAAMVHITGGAGLTLKKVNKLMMTLHQYLDRDANIIFGAKVEENEGPIKLLAVVTGIAELDDAQSDDHDEVDMIDDLELTAERYST